MVIFRLSQQRIPQINIWRLFRLFLVTKTKAKTVNCNSHKENCKNYWFLIEIWEKLKNIFLLVSTLAIILLLHHELIKHIIYSICSKLHYRYITDMIHYRDMKVNNLSKSPSLALLFIWKLCWSFLLKVVTTIFLLVFF